jgi:hypothetical protein
LPRPPPPCSIRRGGPQRRDQLAVQAGELVAGARLPPGRHRNAEFITARDGQLAETQVFFGGQVAPG